MAEIADAIIEESVQAESTEGKQSVGSFVDGVEQRTNEALETVETAVGADVDAIAADTRAALRSYVTTTVATLGAEHMVGDTASKGAAAWNDKGNGNEIVFDTSALATTVDVAYWKRVRLHEEVHQLEQAATFNMGSITYADMTLEVSPCLVEWHAITASGQPMSDLTSDYIKHKEQGDALVAFLGSREPLLTALETGDMAALQRRIDEKVMEQAYETLKA